MNTRLSFLTRAGLSAAAMLPATAVLAHSGHGAPSVHAHTGSPSMLVVLGIVTLGVASLAGLARLILRRHRLRRQG
ncbi:hypothetical protein DFP85_12046 [Halomonas ventosae]|uniref:Secreted protein with PEP-CTERM sorting signal n=1 Tax=Halomonas ventosae TaxID=229007 RepID=A0A4R6ZFX4_9GAMM|nr:hypothetical protein [Halomonas ventosae]TDR50995.1 hypothetical protein DFP85_12046 [Halomonas ventosae]